MSKLLVEEKKIKHNDEAGGRIIVHCRGCGQVVDGEELRLSDGMLIGVAAFPGRCFRCRGRLQELFGRQSREYSCEGCERGDSYNHNTQ